MRSDRTTGVVAHQVDCWQPQLATECGQQSRQSGKREVLFITERAATVPGKIHGNAALVVGEDRDNVAP